MNSFKLISIFLFAISVNANIHNEIANKWLELSKEFGLDSKEHGFCYLYNGEIYGKTAHLKARLASTSKPLTSLMALKTQGPNYEHQTEVISDGRNIHLIGSDDGMFNEDKIFYLIGRLNALGITELDNLSFDNYTPIFAIALYSRMSMSEAWYSKEYNIEQLEEYFNLDTNKDIQSRLRRFLKNTPSEILNDLGISSRYSDYKMSTKRVFYSTRIPLIDYNYNFTLTAPKLLTYLKYQNSVSHNWLADITYRSFGARSYGDWFLENLAEESFGNDYYQKRIGFKDQEPHALLYTGSGLDSKINDERVDNYATCAIIVKAYEQLELELADYGKGLSDILPVAGVDIGTLANRLNARRNLGSIMAKTGTLMNTKSLAGKLKTKSGDIFFGFFHHVYKANGSEQYNAKIVQDLMTEYLIEEFGGAKPLIYKRPKQFFPLKLSEAVLLE
ncbi:hypothetical protein DAY19_12520 [Halobacteriovorax vibrionivorans]|uniref:D-alanyl-D-alanine carboxypeptidase/D-alanyl-D-alanine-endopeptidase n=1 Tax=Halobacteriovorax vibrionivorans TaxID=2152716 RepID=A0ABY0ICW8_9BACT|nr:MULTISPECIES: D-alanyl-D-alanine carboxypeptidase [Halobacteriovorax]RZF20804.1 hypothetical protein DAY19_12520 [Halobacteriovorax vibrionivorans]TGD48188.1 hypothetical protein EP118_04620 [Halobacteriovorax sp. Y22]